MKIATAPRYNSTVWTPRDVSWDDLLKKLQTPVRRYCTRAEFDKLPAVKRTEQKDAGGFVGGWFNGTTRRACDLAGRSLLTFDLDSDPPDGQTLLKRISGLRAALYSTFKSLPGKWRWRLLIPLSRDLKPEEYEPVARRFAAERLDLRWVDPKSFVPVQLMFWPACPKDVDPVFLSQDGAALDVDAVLQSYKDWHNPEEWPRLASEPTARAVKKAGDPLVRPGVIGELCRAYTMTEALETFFEGVYEQISDTRWHLVGSDSGPGAVVYQDKWLYSHHAHDPGANQLLNVFDLLRVHKFADLDKDAPAGTPVTELPSYKEALRFARADRRVLEAEFGPVQTAEAPQDWKGCLDLDKAGDYRSTFKNLTDICSYDPKLQGIGYDLFTESLAVRGPLPWPHEGAGWKDEDLDSLGKYIAHAYPGINNIANLHSALRASVSELRSFHPVRDWLDGLEWDGKERLDTLLIDLLGAEDSAYTRAVTRKTFAAAVARIYKPGCKFDQMLVLVGPQGIGKSQIFRLLAGDWFCDSLQVSNMTDKSGPELLMGAWIAEVAELSGLRKAEVEAVKAFLSRQDDQYRAAYGRVVGRHPRKSIVVGTTNAEDGFLRDTTGNRRFWPVRVSGLVPPDRWQLDAGQVWAEARARYLQGETLYLDAGLQAAAESEQREHLERDEREGVIEDFLESPLPEDWENKSLPERLQWLDCKGDFGSGNHEPGVRTRESVCILEIWCECLRQDRNKLDRLQSNAIKAMLERLGWRTLPRGSSGDRRRLALYGLQRVYVSDQNQSQVSGHTPGHGLGHDEKAFEILM